MRRAARITARKRRRQKHPAAPERTAPMSPTTEQIRIPQGTRLERRPTVQPSGNDERPMVRTRNGHVLAQIDAWRPDWAVN